LSSVTTVGLDLAKHVFQVHAIDAFGRVIVAKALRRKDVLAFFAQLPECLVASRTKTRCDLGEEAHADQALQACRRRARQ
jgi:hypothetical protein